MFMERMNERVSTSIRTFEISETELLTAFDRQTIMFARSFFFIQVEIKHELRLNNYYCYYWSCFCWQFIGLTLSTAYAICIADTFFVWYERKNVDIDHFGFFFCFVLFCFFHSKRIRTVEHSIECFNWTGTRKLNLRVSRSITRQEYQIPRHLHRTQFQSAETFLFRLSISVRFPVLLTFFRCVFWNQLAMDYSNRSINISHSRCDSICVMLWQTWQRIK